MEGSVAPHNNNADNTQGPQDVEYDVDQTTYRKQSFNQSLTGHKVRFPFAFFSCNERFMCNSSLIFSDEHENVCFMNRGDGLD